MVQAGAKALCGNGTHPAAVRHCERERVQPVPCAGPAGAPVGREPLRAGVRRREEPGSVGAPRAVPAPPAASSVPFRRDPELRSAEAEPPPGRSRHRRLRRGRGGRGASWVRPVSSVPPAAAAAPGRRSVTASGDGERRVPGAGSSASLPRGQRLPARDGAKPREAPEEAGQARLGFAGGPRRSFPVCTCGGLYVNQSSMDRYRYFIFNQRSMVVLGLFQIAFSTVCIVSGLIDGVFRTESQLSTSRAPVWAGMVMGVPGLLALFSSQRKNPVLVNVLIVSSITSYVAILIIIVYSSLTLNYGEEEELSSASVHVIHTKFILNKVVKAANVAMLAASVCSAFVVLVMAYLGCRSLPCCSCYDSVTGMEWLQPSEDQSQTVEMICAAQSPGGRIFNFPDQFPAQDLDAEEDASKPPPYIRMA